jgi:hypothetical protein
MQLDLYCEHCGQAFEVPADSSTAHVLEQVADVGPWAALGDGETLEDLLSTTLTREESIHCPQCGERVPVSEVSLSRCAQELLLQW